MFRTLPPLPNGLQWLQVSQCDLFALLPPLPPSLRSLSVVQTGVRRLPLLSDTIESIYAHPDSFECKLLGVPRTPILHPDWNKKLDQMVSLSRTVSRTASLKESLMMSAWHPSRVSRWLEHGEPTLDMMFGLDPVAA